MAYMYYRSVGERHELELDKNELIMLIAILHEGLESLRTKAVSGEALATMKYENASALVNALSKSIIDS